MDKKRKMDKEIIEIVNRFMSYLDTGKEIYINQYSTNKLKMVLSNVSKNDINSRWYREIENRISYLDKQRLKKKKIIKLIIIIVLMATVVAFLFYIIYNAILLNSP